MDRKSMFLDTNTCERMASPKTRSVISKRFSIVVSPLSLMELIDGIRGGTSEDHFRADQKKMAALTGTDPKRRRFLRWPVAFVLQTVLARNHNLPIEQPLALRKIATCVLRAHSKSHLDAGTVRLSVGNGWGINLDNVQERQDLGKSIHREWLREAKTGKRFPGPEQWALRFGNSFLQAEISSSEALKLAERLSAAREYQKELFVTVSQNPNYDINAHDSDWVDGQQLMYLCDPAMHMLTLDNKLIERVRASPQCNRIHHLSEFE